MQIFGFIALALAAHALSAEDGVEFFEKRVRPVLASNCYSCHGPDKQFGALRLDSKERLLKGGQSGPAAIPGKPEESLLIKAVRHQGPKMPMGGKLSDSDIAALEDWVRQGLPWPEAKIAAKAGAGDPGFYQKLIREHWAFQPVLTTLPPRGDRNPVDAFIRVKLDQAKLKPARPAKPRDLARRLSNVLTGLPPVPHDMQRFLDGRSPAAYEAYVDRLLASEHFGEQWARHWMDVVRYAETYGYEWNYEIHGAWRYRDYLIRAFNTDVPYDQFVREHIAGDLLDKPRTRDNGKWNESAVGTTFFRLGEMGHDDCIQFREIRTDVVDNQIDTMTKAFQGVTVSCARCHDHKIDPIPTEDYYALYGILNSSRPITRTLNMRGPGEAARASLVQLKSKIRVELADAWLKETSALGAQLTAALAWRKDSQDGVASNLDPLRINLWLKLLNRKKTDLEDPLYPMMQIADGQQWADVAKQYDKEATERDQYNHEKFVEAGDFGKELPPGWSTDGLGLRAGHSASGDFAVATGEYLAVAGIFPSGLFTNLLSDRMNGVLRSPLLPKSKKYISMRILGGNVAAQRTIVDHCVIGEQHEIIDNADLKWVTMPTKGDQQLPIYLELNTKADNPRLPERPGKFPNVTDADLVSPRSYFGVTRAYFHDEKVTPKADLSHMKRYVAIIDNTKQARSGGADTPVGALPPGGDLAPNIAAGLTQHFQNTVQDALRAWRDGRASDDDVVWLDWLLREQIVANSRNLTPALRALTDQYRAAEAGLEDPAVIYSMGDFDRGSDNPIFNGGQALNLGRPAPRHFLTLMPPELRQVGTEQSGRRELAEAMASARNPLTARLMVNRIWHYVFGRGLAATTDNFGRYGERPTHPELLDYLAARFVEEGWSVKKLIRLLVTSETFQQSSEPNEADSQNLNWSHYPVRRLDAEAVRDNILAVSGRLDQTLYGPSVSPHRGEAKEYRRLFQGPLDGNGRRSIYLKVTRMEGPRFLELFDLPPPLQTRGNRDVTNVPSQSLALLNDPFVLDQASVWAERLVARKDDAIDARLTSMFLQALARPPAPEELERWRSLTSSLAAGQGVATAEILLSKTVWKDVAHTFFNTKEFLYLK